MDIRTMLRNAGMTDPQIEDEVRRDRLSTEAVMQFNKMRRSPGTADLAAATCDAWNTYAAACGSAVRLGHSLDGGQDTTPTATAGKLTGKGGK